MHLGFGGGGKGRTEMGWGAIFKLKQKMYMRIDRYTCPVLCFRENKHKTYRRCRELQGICMIGVHRSHARMGTTEYKDPWGGARGVFQR